MPLSTNLREYIAACFTALWIQSHEHEDALAEIAQLCRDEEWQLATWDVSQGLQIAGQGEEADSTGADPLAAIRAINTLATPNGSAIVVLSNFHRFMNSGLCSALRLRPDLSRSREMVSSHFSSVQCQCQSVQFSSVMQ